MPGAARSGSEVPFMNAQSVEGVFGKSWDLLTRNWVLIVPGLVVGFVVGIAHGVFETSADAQTVPGAIGQMIGGLVLTIISILGAIANTAYTTGMAGAAWLAGTTTLADGRRAFERDAGHVLVAMVALFVLGVLAAVLAIPTLGLALIAYALLFIYTMPSAVVGEHRGLDALAESYRIVTKRFLTTLIVVVLIAVIAILAGVIATALKFAPFVGPLISAVIWQITLTYATLVVVGEYLNLRNDSTPTIV